MPGREEQRTEEEGGGYGPHLPTFEISRAAEWRSYQFLPTRPCDGRRNRVTTCASKKKKKKDSQSYLPEGQRLFAVSRNARVYEKTWLSRARLACAKKNQELYQERIEERRLLCKYKCEIDP